MADPAYIDADGVLTDGEAWVPLHTCTPTGTKLCQMISANDGSTLDWSQYMDLVVIVASKSVKASGDTDTLLGYFNNDTTTNYQVNYYAADGASFYKSRTTTAFMNLGNSLTEDANAAASASLIWHIFDINSGKYKNSTTQWACDKDGTGSWTVGLYPFVWQSTAAITEIDLNMEDANYDTGTMISLFGVLPRMVA